MPHCVAIARAVSTLSPVTIRTTIPAFWHRRTASVTPLRKGSSIAKIPKHTSPDDSRHSTSDSTWAK
ncbi:hypothetical protein H4S02_001419 [Coemansia sp. RSA 2611]|nr:hypothetical protein H4S02_001419 [Coemansia sp. RSA 2611]